ncbi:uncharacterized protein J7T54_000813, partial [Emericellopsis cladophorae]
PGTVVVETLVGRITTITTGVPGITGTQTTTIPPSGTGLGTVIIQTPEDEDPDTGTFTTGDPTITAPTTSSIPPSGTNPGTVIVKTPDPLPETIPQIFITITTGNPTITGPVMQTIPYTGTDPGTVLIQSACGSGTLDNYIWGMLLPVGGQSGDGVDLIRHDPVPTGYKVADWAFVPGGGEFLSGLLYRVETTALGRWSTIINEWDIVQDCGVVTGTGTDADIWGAVYSAANGFLYTSENDSGQIWRFPVRTGGDPELVVDGPVSSRASWYRRGV